MECHPRPAEAKSDGPNAFYLEHVGTFLKQLLEIRKLSRGINYGSNKVRFTAPVPVGSRVRLSQTLKNVEDIDGGVRMTFESTMEIEGSARPALVAETLSLAYD